MTNSTMNVFIKHGHIAPYEDFTHMGIDVSKFKSGQPYATGSNYVMMADCKVGDNYYLTVIPH